MTTAPPKRSPIPFGKYLLLDRVNIGGMAEVWRAKTFGAGGFERLVAIKRILPSIAEDEEFITMFLDEAKITVQLNHANIAQIYELSTIASSYFIAMEYVSGRDMRAVFEKCRKRGEAAPIPLVCYAIAKACEGLDYAHRKKDAAGRDMRIVHRDVSPQNVLISYDGEIKVIDFGIAKAAGKANKTQAGILKGKFGYMSPEQIRGLELDQRSDLFAIGVCLYELLTGERLFVGDSDFSILEKVRKVEILPPTHFNRRIPEALERIVLKALAREVDERYQFCSELADDLQRFLITSDTVFGRKDLAAFMKATFAEDFDKERQRLVEYGDIKAPDGLQLADATFGAPGGMAPRSSVPGAPPRSSASQSNLQPVKGPAPSMPRLTAAPAHATTGRPEHDATQVDSSEGEEATAYAPEAAGGPTAADEGLLEGFGQRGDADELFALVGEAPDAGGRPPPPEPQEEVPSEPTMALTGDERTMTAEGLAALQAPPRPSAPKAPPAPSVSSPKLAPVGGPAVSSPKLAPVGSPAASAPKLAPVGAPSVSSPKLAPVASAPRPAPAPAPQPSAPRPQASAPRPQPSAPKAGLPGPRPSVGEPAAAAAAPAPAAEPGAAAGKRKTMIIAAAAAAGVALLLIIGLAMRPAAHGVLLLNLPPELGGKAQVQLNGKALTEADGSPIKEWPQTRDVPVGTITVLIRAPGYKPFIKDVEVRAGKGYTEVGDALEKAP